MKNLLLLTALILFINTSFAFDPPPHPDTLHFSSEQEQLLQVPVLIGTSQPATIEPVSQNICFDKHMLIKSSVNGMLVEQCLWINTTDGLIGHLKPARSGGISLCDIKPNEINFSFFVFGLKGNTYHYFTRKGKTGIEQLMSTSNSQQYLYEVPETAGSNSAVMHLKTETRMYCNDKFKGKAYKFDGSNQTWFLSGRDYPPTLTWEKYFGNFGVGYLKTDKGMYMIMEMESPGMSFKVEDFEDQDVCFKPQQFKIMEDQFYTKRRAELDKEQQKILQEEAKLSQGSCRSERSDLLNFKKEELRKQEENLENSMVGNSLQNVQTQQAMLGMMDPEEMIRQNILETKVNICKKEEYLVLHPGPQADAVNKLHCLQDLLSDQQNTLSEMQILDTQYATNPGQAFALKNKKYWDLIKAGPCD